MRSGRDGWCARAKRAWWSIETRRNRRCSFEIRNEPSRRTSDATTARRGEEGADDVSSPSFVGYFIRPRDMRARPSHRTTRTDGPPRPAKRRRERNARERFPRDSLERKCILDFWRARRVGPHHWSRRDRRRGSPTWRTTCGASRCARATSRSASRRSSGTGTITCSSRATRGCVVASPPAESSYTRHARRTPRLTRFFPPRPQASAPVGSPSASRETASVIRRSVDWNAESRDTAGLTMDERAFLAELASRRALVTDRARTTEVREALAAGARPMPVARPSTALPRRPSASESSENVPLDPSSADVALRPAPGGASPAKRGARPRTAVPSSRSRASIASSLSAYARRRSVTFASPRDEHDDAVRLSAESIAAGAGVTSSPSSASLRGSRTRSVGPGTSALADAQTSTNRRLRFSSPGGGGGVGLAAEPRPTDWRASLRGGYDGGPGAGANRAATTNAKSPARPDVPRGILRKSDDASATRVSMSADEEAFLVALAAERRMTTDRAKSAAKTSAGTSAFASDPIAAQPGVEKPPSLGKAVNVSSPSPSRNRRTDAVVRAGWRPAPSPSRSRERPATAAARMSREHAEKHVETSPPGRASGIGGGRRRRQRPREGEGEVARRADVDRRRAATRVRVEPEPVGNGGSFAGARAAADARVVGGEFRAGVSVEGVVAGARLRASASARARRRRSGSGRGGGSGSGNRNWSAARAEAIRKRGRARRRRGGRRARRRRGGRRARRRRGGRRARRRRGGRRARRRRGGRRARRQPRRRQPRRRRAPSRTSRTSTTGTSRSTNSNSTNSNSTNSNSPRRPRRRRRRVRVERPARRTNQCRLRRTKQCRLRRTKQCRLRRKKQCRLRRLRRPRRLNPSRKARRSRPRVHPRPRPNTHQRVRPFRIGCLRRPSRRFLGCGTVDGRGRLRRRGAGPRTADARGSATPAPVSPPPRTEGMSYRERRDVWKEAKAASTGREGEDA